ncbi:TPA: hypothetical protein EYP66_17045 [Candidatus Poribacteria bacterium]|nr:hypothetical protein [Candidatus Poribacteria bacterium]
MLKLFHIALMILTVRLIAATANADKNYAMIMAQTDERPYPAPSSPISRLQREGIRGMSSGDPEKMAAAGFNLILPWERILRDSKRTTSPDSSIILTPEDFSEKAVERLRSWAIKCARNNLVMMYMMYVADEESVRHLTGDILGHLRSDNGVLKAWPTHRYRHVVDWDGNTAKYAPCPLERRYWMGFIRPQLELVARVLKETGATGGGALELETYVWGSIYPGYSNQKKTFCYGDHCFYGFVRSLGERRTPVEVPSDRRFDWLTQRGLLPRYEKYLEKSMTELIREMMREVRKVNPNFLFGLYPYTPFWYYDALIRGSGTPELPCLLFPGPEYIGGYLANPPFDFFGAAPTPASVAHLRRGKLPAMYAGGLWARVMGSPNAVAMAMDRMLRGPDGYWIYNDFPGGNVPEQFWTAFFAINQWTTDNPGPLPAGDLSQNAMTDAIKWVNKNKPDGIVVNDGQIVARYDGRANEVYIAGGDFDSGKDVAEGWQGRGSLPPLDDSVFHSGLGSILFEPSAGRSERPRSPYIDQEVPEAKKGQSYELSFWIKTAGTNDPIRFWVGRADSSQYPGYMWYSNYFLPPNHDWMRLRVPVSYQSAPPLVLRFWCPPTDGKLWLDDVKLRPVQTRIIHVPLNPPANVTSWGIIDWKLSPSDARCDAEIIDAKDEQKLRMRLYPGDSLAPLAAVVGMKPVLLRLKVYPSAVEPVILEKVQVGFTFHPRGHQ